MLTANKLIKRNNLPWQKIENQILVLTPNQSMIHELNESASWIWQHLEKEFSLKALVDDFIKEYDIDTKTASKDIEELVVKMNKQKIIEFQ